MPRLERAMNVIELGGSSIRLVREREGRIVGLDQWPVPPGADPVMALAAAPVPAPLGRVAVVLHHDDLLLRSMVQPAASPERLDKLVRFEIASMAGEGSDPVSVAWHAVNASFPGGDLRVLALVAKQRLLARLREAVATHGGKLTAVVPPALGLYHAWRMQETDVAGQIALVDVGGKRVHIALVQEGELLFLRTQTPGMEELVKSVAERRGVPEAEAQKIVARLGKGAPEDLREMIAKQAGAIAAGVTAAVRFAKAQLKIDRFEPQAIHLAGAGAQAPGFAEALKERAGVPVRLLNPFSGVLSTLPAEDMDRHAALPSPWTAAIGVAQAKRLELDALHDDRARASHFWRTDGVLRVAAALVAGLLVLALVRREVDIARAGAAVAELKGEAGAGLVPTAEAHHARLKELQEARERSATKLAWLDQQRRPGRVAAELLSAIALQQDPVDCPVVLTAYRVKRIQGAVEVEIEGYAKSAGKKGTDAVLKEFEDGLKRRYTPIRSIQAQPRAISAENQGFQYRIAVAD